MKMTGNSANEDTGAEWAIYDEIDFAIRELDEEFDFSLRVEKTRLGYTAVVTVNVVPGGDLLAFGRRLETRFANEGLQVEISFAKGDVPQVNRPDFTAAKEAFDKIWGNLSAHIEDAEAQTLLGPPPVRDFIYLDVELLASLFAQCKRGLTTLVAMQERGVQSGRTTADQAASLISFGVDRFRGEMSVLHDYMYHLVERDLSASIVNVVPAQMSSLSSLRELRDSRMCKVNGIAQMNDYKRMALFLEKFNQLAEAIAYAQLQSPKMAATLATLKAALGTASREQKQKLHEGLKSFSDVKKYAKSVGLHHDEKNLENLKLMMDMFIGDAFEVQIRPQSVDSGPMFRALLRKEFLRIPPDRLRLLYGPRTQSAWTLVGSVTFISGLSEGVAAQSPNAAALPADPTPQVPGQTVSMRQPFDQMFNALGFMERGFVEAPEANEIIVMPLAIYRDLRE